MLRIWAGFCRYRACCSRAWSRWEAWWPWYSPITTISVSANWRASSWTVTGAPVFAATTTSSYWLLGSAGVLFAGTAADAVTAAGANRRLANDGCIGADTLRRAVGFLAGVFAPVRAQPGCH